MQMSTRKRKWNRFPGWNYNTEGWYFVTLCTHHRQSWFGKIKDEQIFLSEIGLVATEYWLEIPNHFKDVEIDEFIVMPNHLHGIVEINKDPTVGNGYNRSLQRQNELLPKIIGSYKTAVSRSIKIRNLDFSWQKSFYDHIIRNEKSLYKIRKYIRYNHLKWHNDLENPKYIQGIPTNKISEKNKLHYQDLFSG